MWSICVFYDEFTKAGRCYLNRAGTYIGDLRGRHNIDAGAIIGTVIESVILCQRTELWNSKSENLQIKDF